jgi:hypothetical protein
MLLTPTTGLMSHMVASHQRRQIKLPVISTNQTYKSSYLTQNRSRVTKFMNSNIDSTERRSPSAGVDGMLLHINGKFTT